MQILNRKELNGLLGVKDFFEASIELIDKIDYLGGIEDFDSLLKGRYQSEYGASLHLIKRPNGLEIKLAKTFSSKSIGVLNNQLTRVIIEHKETFIENKDKSVIGRAVIGSILLGPLGAVIGGMSGLSSGTKIVIPDSIILFEGEVDRQKFSIVFSCTNENLLDTKAFFSELGIPIEEISESDNIDNGNTKYDDLERLGRMFKEGLLTKEEFEKEKGKLLK